MKLSRNMKIMTSPIILALLGMILTPYIINGSSKFVVLLFVFSMMILMIFALYLGVRFIKNDELKMVNLFLDDVRVPIDAYYYTVKPMYRELDWAIVRDYEDFVSFITEYYEKNSKLPDKISFDHDLGITDCENWKDVLSLNGQYRVSSLGRIANGTEFLIPKKSSDGLYVTIGGEDVYLHKIIMRSFCGTDVNKPFIRHKDGNKFNNHLKNLEWCTDEQTGNGDYFIPPTFNEKTGYDCVKWLVDFCIDNKIQLTSKYFSHSMNTVGRENILAYLDNYKKHNI